MLIWGEPHPARLNDGQCSVQMIMQQSWLGIIRLFLLYHDLLVGATPILAW